MGKECIIELTLPEVQYLAATLLTLKRGSALENRILNKLTIAELEHWIKDNPSYIGGVLEKYKKIAYLKEQIREEDTCSIAKS